MALRLCIVADVTAPRDLSGWEGSGRAVFGERRFSARGLFARQRYYTRCQTKLIPTVVIQSGPAAPFVRMVSFLTILNTARDHVTPKGERT